jgi:alkylhydroperoxidase family enzyme
MISFLAVPEPDAASQPLFDDDLVEPGFIMNSSRLWAYQPSTQEAMFEVMRRALATCPLTLRERGVLVAATASTLGDAYCSIAWGCKLANASDVATAVGVLRGDDAGLTGRERALAGWARKVAGDPNRTSGSDVQELRDAGYGDAQIFGITVYIAMRVAFAVANDALGARPDAEYRDHAPAAILESVTFGRPIADP